MHPESGVWMIHAVPESRNSSGDSAPVVMAMPNEDENFMDGFRGLAKPESCISVLDTEIFNGTVAKVRVRETDIGASDMEYAC